MNIGKPILKLNSCVVFIIDVSIHILAGGGGDDVEEGGSYKEFAAEYAKSNRSTCRGCDEKIEKVWAVFHTCSFGVYYHG